MDEDKTAALVSVRSFLALISKTRPPFAEARKLILPEAFCVYSHLDELWVNRLDKTMDKIEAEVFTALDINKEFREELAEPGPEVWIHDDFATVWTGHHTFVDDKKVAYSLKLFSLHKTADGWKISGIADTQEKGGSRFPPVSKVVTTEVMEPINLHLDSLEHKNWGSSITSCLVGSGVTNSRRSTGMLFSSTWPQLLDRIKGVYAQVPVGVALAEILYDVEVRIWGDFAFAWTPFLIKRNGQTINKGVNAFTLLKMDSGWIITGCQDTSMLA